MRLSWTQRLSGFIPDTPKPAIPPVGSFSGYTLSDWQRSVEHIVYARELFTQPMFRDLLSVLNNSRPEAALKGVTEAEALILLGVHQGYALLLGKLLSLVQLPIKEPDTIEADYGAKGYEDAI